MEAESEELREEIKGLRADLDEIKNAVKYHASIFDKLLRDLPQDSKYYPFRVENTFFEMLHFLIRIDKIKVGTSVNALIEELNKLISEREDFREEQFCLWLGAIKDYKSCFKKDNETFLAVFKNCCVFPPRELSIRIKDDIIADIKFDEFNQSRFW